MTFQQVIEALQQRFPGASIGTTAEAGQYYERAVGIADYERRSDSLYVGHWINGKEMRVYYSVARKLICCGGS